MKDSQWKKSVEKITAVAAWVVAGPAVLFTIALFFILRGIEWYRLGKGRRNFKKGTNKDTEVKRQK